jgi:hypothetical protein
MRRILVTFLLLINASAALAQTGTFHGFASNAGLYAPTLLASDGNWYAVEPDSPYIYQITPAGVATLIVNDFHIGNPTLCFEGSDGLIYGVLSDTEPGPSIFKMTFQGQVTTVAQLPVEGGDYSYVPSCPVMANDGNFYGGSAGGGSYSAGYLYQITPSGQVNIFYNFTGNFSIDGKVPVGR